MAYKEREVKRERRPCSSAALLTPPSPSQQEDGSHDSMQLCLTELSWCFPLFFLFLSFYPPPPPFTFTHSGFHYLVYFSSVFKLTYVDLFLHSYMLLIVESKQS